MFLNGLIRVRVLLSVFSFLTVSGFENDYILRRIKNIPDSVSPQQYTFSLGDVVAFNNEKVGEKARYLAFLKRNEIQVPEAFVISTEGYTAYKEGNEQLPQNLWEEIKSGIKELERETGFKFGDRRRPLIISVRSSPPVPMPGILATILNIGINDATVEGLIEKAGGGEEGLFFGFDTYRRFIENFAPLVYKDKIDRDFFINLENEFLRQKGKKNIKELSGEEMKELVVYYLNELQQGGITIPQDVDKQLRLAVEAVFSSWDSPTAEEYRRDYRISDELGTAIIVQRMLFGNLNNRSGVGIAFFGKRFHKGTIEEWMESYYRIKAQGDEIMTPEERSGLESLHSSNSPYSDPGVTEENKQILNSLYSELERISRILMGHFNRPQEMEFVFENGYLYILQIRDAQALSNDDEFLLQQGLWDPQGAISLLQDQERKLKEKSWDVYKYIRFPSNAVVLQGESFGRGAVKGKLVFSVEEAERLYALGETPILFTTHRDDKIIKAMMEGKIAGLITTYGNRFMHEAVISDIYVIPGIIIPEDSLTLPEGEEIIIYAGEQKGYIIKPTSEIEFSGAFEHSSRISDFDFESYFREVEEEYAEHSLSEIVEEHLRLVSEVGDMLRQLSELGGDRSYDELLEDILLLNLKAHFLHRLIEERQKEEGISDEEIADIEIRVIEENISSKHIYRSYKIGNGIYELADAGGARLIGLKRILVYDTIEWVELKSIEKPLEGRYFLAPTSFDMWGVDRIKQEQLVRDFLGFAEERLRQRGIRNFLRLNSIIQKAWDIHSSGAMIYITFYGVDFPKENLSMVLELVQEWVEQNDM